MSITYSYDEDEREIKFYAPIREKFYNGTSESDRVINQNITTSMFTKIEIIVLKIDEENLIMILCTTKANN